MSEQRYVKKTVDWQTLRAEVNRRLNADYAVNYLQNVWNGNLKSAKILEVLKELIPDDPELRGGPDA